MEKPMVSGTGKRLKVVWLCHLNNEYITQQLGVKPSFEFAPWISRFAEIFEKYNEVDVHIVAPHNQIIQNKSFARNNIHYHFFPYLIPYIPRRVFHWLHRNTNYKWNKWKIKRIVNKIEPDLIHLFGTENAYFTSSIFQFKNRYPVFITIQGFARFLQNKSKHLQIRKEVENEIIRTYSNFGVRDEEMSNLIKSINPNANLFHHDIAPYIPKVFSVIDTDKEFDIVFFARVSYEKGIEDLIIALSIVKNKIDNVSLVVVGPTSKPYLQRITNLVKHLKLENNVFFKGSMPSIDDVHKIVANSRICVLPTHSDTIPGTIIESMFIGIPCISYKVGGLPTLNMGDSQTIMLIEKGNINELAAAISHLLENKSERELLVGKARQYAHKRWSDSNLHLSIINIYKRI